MVIRTFCATHIGVEGEVVEVQVGGEKSLPKVQVTGLAHLTIKESVERIKICLSKFGFSNIPSGRLIVHLMPANEPKIGSHFDLSIAVGILAAEKVLFVKNVSEIAFLGELSLDGRILGIKSSLALVEALSSKPFIKNIIIPVSNAWEAALIKSEKILVAETFSQILEFLFDRCPLQKCCDIPFKPNNESLEETISEVIGQKLAIRGLEIALSGRHHIIMVGSPGVGKTLLAETATKLLPELSNEEMIEVIKNYVFYGIEKSCVKKRPFRAPHHSISAAALLGGGSGTVIPGEVTLAHNGVLFLDEFPEFKKDVIEGLREPLQNGCIHLHRIGKALTLPARFTLIAAMNPCPCGYAFDKNNKCHCTRERKFNYHRKISGAILDRCDIYVTLSENSNLNGEIFDYKAFMSSVSKAIARQKRRYEAFNKNYFNGDVDVSLFKDDFFLGKNELIWVENIYESGKISMRGLFRLIKVARTIADLDDSSKIELTHLKEAWGFKCPDSGLQFNF